MHQFVHSILKKYVTIKNNFFLTLILPEISKFIKSTLERSVNSTAK